MDLDREACYRAVKARDRRNDGRFLTGVLSTGIFCRPICPARTPRFENCVLDRKSTRLNSSHVRISYAVFCLKKKTSEILAQNATQITVSIRECSCLVSRTDIQN